MSKTINVNGTECNIHVGNYPTHKLAMYVQLVEAETKEPYCVATRNFGNFYREGSFVQFGTSFFNKDFILDALKEEGLVTPYVCFGTPVVAYSGFCEYPYMQFDMEKLKEYDPKGVAEYEKTWIEECSVQQDILNREMFGDYEEDFDEDYDEEEYDEDER